MILETISIKPSKIKSVNTKDNLEITFESGEVVILKDYHDQDCCESVYADFGNINHYLSQLTAEYEQIVIEGVKDMGFLIGFKSKYRDVYPLENILIPCYNEQNGYYSDSLSLQIIYPDGKEKQVDITEYKKDYID